VGPGDRCSFGACPSPNKYLPRIGTVSSSGTESQRTVEFSNSSIIIAFFISRIALETGHTFLPEFKQQTKTLSWKTSQHRRVSVLLIWTWVSHMSCLVGRANESIIFLETITEPENGHYRHTENTILWTNALPLSQAFFLLTVGSGTTCVIIEKKAVSRPQERFNYLHSSLRNVIERCFGVPFSYSQGHALFLVEAEVHCTCLLCYQKLY
jgi:hypothetical protein